MLPNQPPWATRLAMKFFKGLLVFCWRSKMGPNMRHVMMQHIFVPNIKCRVNVRFDSSTFSNVRRHHSILTRARQNGLVANVFKDFSNTCFDMWDNCLAIFFGCGGEIKQTQKQHTAMIQKTSFNLAPSSNASI